MSQACVSTVDCRVSEGLKQAWSAGTAAVVLPVPAARAWAVLADPLTAVQLFRDVKAVQFELQSPPQRAAGGAEWWEAVKGLQTHKLERLAVQQDSEVRMLGLRCCVRMHMDMTVDHSRRQIFYNLARRNRLMRSVAGSITVLALAERPACSGVPGSEAVLHAIADHPHVAGIHASRRAGQHCIVVLHQTVDPAVVPPPPFGRMLRGNLLTLLRGMMHDLLLAPQLQP